MSVATITSVWLPSSRLAHLTMPDEEVERMQFVGFLSMVHSTFESASLVLQRKKSAPVPSGSVLDGQVVSAPMKLVMFGPVASTVIVLMNGIFAVLPQTSWAVMKTSCEP